MSVKLFKNKKRTYLALGNFENKSRAKFNLKINSFRITKDLKLMSMGMQSLIPKRHIEKGKLQKRLLFCLLERFDCHSLSATLRIKRSK